ncbi:hypothetical protein ABT364_05565 [Massilia sp. SR12]
MPKVEAVVGFVDQGLSGAAAADTIVSGVKDGSQSFQLVNKAGVAFGAIVSAVPALRPIAIQANVFSASTTFLKIMLDVQEGREWQLGDAVTVVGATAGIIATVLFFSAAAPGVMLVMTGISIGANLYSLLTGPTLNGINDSMRSIAQETWPTIPVVEMPALTVTSTGGIASYAEIINDPSLKFGALEVNSDGTTRWVEARYTPEPPPQGTPGTEGFKCSDCHAS